ncbi:1574_t:CDS:2 [Dentiscutata erythropus]|uniref:1574_t:CDS:1 n=1 Tax=Dentiscutata erythropus TaxID=1348616 RepID=A0A9N8WTR5_9GLOM|nr:1574_t:CDS:2 [Dentiscutata erythropus]
MSDYSTVYDLSISPAFGVFTAPIQDPGTATEDTAAFYATRKRLIFLVAGELVLLKNTAYILCDPIEWTYPTSGTSNNSVANTPAKASRRQRNDDLEKLAEKFNSLNIKNQMYREQENAREDPQEECSTRANVLRLAINDIKGNNITILHPKKFQQTDNEPPKTNHNTPNRA